MQSETIQKVSMKIFQVLEETGWLDKESTVTMGNRVAYSYTSETQFITEIRPLLMKHKLVLLPVRIDDIIVTEKVGDKGPSYITTIKATYRFVDPESGEFIELQTAGQGADATDKGIYKALTGAYKYCLREAFMIPTGDDPEATNEYNERVAKVNQSRLEHLIGVARKHNINLNDPIYMKMYEDAGINPEEHKNDAVFVKNLTDMIVMMKKDNVSQQEAIEKFLEKYTTKENPQLS